METTTNQHAPWPNKQPVVDGVTPTSEVSQDPNLFENTDEDLEMED